MTKKIICGVEGCTEEFDNNQDRVYHIVWNHLPLEVDH